MNCENIEVTITNNSFFFFLDPLESNHADCRVPRIKMTNNIFKIKNFTSKNAKGAYFFSITIRAPFIQPHSLVETRLKSLHMITMHIAFSGTALRWKHTELHNEKYKILTSHYHLMGKIIFKWQRKLFLAPTTKKIQF